jgi:2-aminoadipate transaminase
MLEILRKEVELPLEIMPCHGGLYLWVKLPPQIDTGMQSKLFKLTLEEKVLYVPGALCGTQSAGRSPHAHSMRLCFGYPDMQTLREGTHRLARAISRAR